MWKIYLMALSLWSRLSDLSASRTEGNRTAMLDIFVITDLTVSGSPCDSSSVDSLITQTAHDVQMTANVTWIFATNSFNVIVKVRGIPSDACDIVIIDSSWKIFERARTELQTTGILVSHWPSREMIWSAATPQLIRGKCLNVTFGQATVKNEYQYNVAENWKSSSVITSIIEHVMSENLYVIIQNIEESNIYFKEAVLDRISTKYAIYHRLPPKSEGGIRKLLNETSSKMNLSATCIIICDGECIRDILREVNSIRAETNTGIRHFSKWLIFADSRFKPIVEEDLSDIANVGFVSLSSDGEIPCLRQKMLKEVMKAALFQLSCNLLHSPGSSMKYKFAVLFQMYKEKVMGRDLSFRVETLPWQTSRRHFALVGFVCKQNVNILKPATMFPNTLYGFNQRSLKIGTLQWFNFTERRNINGTMVYVGFCMDILNELAKSLNFSYVIKEPEDGQWGSRGKGNNWTGLVGQLQRRDIDMVAANLNVDIGREEVMDFTIPFYYTFITGLFRKPDLSKEKWKTFTRPFSYEIYIALFLVLPISCSILFVFERNNIIYKMDRRDRKRQPKFSDMFFHLFGAMLCQVLCIAIRNLTDCFCTFYEQTKYRFGGNTDTPDSITGRTFMALFWLFSIIMAALYSGTLISFLAITKETIPFKTFDQLLKQDTYKFGSLGGSIYITSFSVLPFPSLLLSARLTICLNAESSVGTIKNLWSAINDFARDDPDVLSSDHQLQVAKVKAGDYVFIAGWNDLTKLGCDLLTIEQILYQNYYAFGLQSNSPYNELISERLAAISESGLQKVWEKKWTASKRVCNDSATAKSREMTLVDFQSAFYLLGIGILLSTFVLILEKWVHKCRHYSVRRRASILPPLTIIAAPAAVAATTTTITSSSDELSD